MAKNKKTAQQEWLSGPDADFDSGQKGFMNIVNANFGIWNIPAGDVTNLQNLQTDWNNKYAVGGKGQKATRSAQQTKDKTDARKMYVSALRQFIGQWLKKNTLASDAQRKSMRVTVPDTTKTKHKDGIKHDIFYTQKNMGGGKHLFACRTSEDSTKSSTAPEADGVIISYSIVDVKALQAKASLLAEQAQQNPLPDANKKAADAIKLLDPPAGPEECDKQKTFSGAKFFLELGSANTGKTLYAFLQWNDSKNPGRVSAPGDLITINI